MPISCEKLIDYCQKALMACKVSEADARTTAEVLVSADMRGVHSHGVIRMIGYVECLLSGGVRYDAVPKIVTEGPSNALVDADQGLGIPASVFATELARKKALESGVAVVNVFNSHHHGACGYYSQSLTDSGLIAMAMSTGDVIMAASGSASRAIGNNPFSYAVPAGKYKAVCYDVAMSTVAAGKISIAADENKSIPLGWLLDPEGNPTTEPKDYDKGGALVAFGGHKGFGLSIMVETMAGLLSGGAMLSDIHAWNKNPDQSGNVGHLIIAMDPKKLNPNIDMPKRTEEMIEELAAAKKAPGVERILFPGQLEHEKEAIAKNEGVNLPQATLDALQKVAAHVNIPFNVEEMQ